MKLESACMEGTLHSFSDWTLLGLMWNWTLLGLMWNWTLLGLMCGIGPCLASCVELDPAWPHVWNWTLLGLNECMELDPSPCMFNPMNKV